MKKIFYSVAIATAMIGLAASCTNSDASKAQQIEGTWLNDADPEDEMTLIFDYDTEAKSNYGTFMEVHSSPLDRYEIEEGMDAMLSYTTTIEGTYRVEGTSLYTTYDLNTFAVTVGDDIQLIIDGLDDLDNADMQAFNAIKGQTADMMQQRIQESLIDAYASDNEQGLPYTDLKVNGNTMTFGTGDSGVVTFKKQD